MSLSFTSIGLAFIRGRNTPIVVSKDQVRVVALRHPLTRREHQPFEGSRVELDPQAGFLRQCQQPIFDDQRFSQQFVYERIACLIDLNRDAGGQCSDQVSVCNERNSVAPSVSCDAKIGGTCPPTDAQAFRNPSGAAYVGLNDIDCPGAYEFSEALDSKIVL